MIYPQRISKVQAALLWAAKDASLLTSSPGVVSDGLFGRIARHFFRPERVFGAVRELVRDGHLVVLRDANYRVVIPTYARTAILPGCEAEPLADGELARMVRAAGYVPATPEVEAIPLPAETPEPEPALATRRARPMARNVTTERLAHRFRMLANHHLAEQWYGSPLPTELSRDIVLAARNDRSASLVMRSALVQHKLMESIPESKARQIFHWRVTESGIEFYRDSGISATLTLEGIAQISSAIGLNPLERSDQPGR